MFKATILDQTYGPSHFITVFNREIAMCLRFLSCVRVTRRPFSVNTVMTTTSSSLIMPLWEASGSTSVLKSGNLALVLARSMNGPRILDY